jgi:hypothetical protein
MLTQQPVSHSDENLELHKGVCLGKATVSVGGPSVELAFAVGFSATRMN